MLLDIVHHRFHAASRRGEDHIELLGEKTFSFAQIDDFLALTAVSDMSALLYPAMLAGRRR